MNFLPNSSPSLLTLSEIILPSNHYGNFHFDTFCISFASLFSILFQYLYQYFFNISFCNIQRVLKTSFQIFYDYLWLKYTYSIQIIVWHSVIHTFSILWFWTSKNVYINSTHNIETNIHKPLFISAHHHLSNFYPIHYWRKYLYFSFQYFQHSHCS